MLKNTIVNKKIIKRNIYNKKELANKIIIFSLFGLLITFKSDIQATNNNVSTEDNSKYILDCEGYGYYSIKYSESLRNIDPSNYDQKFYEIYKNVTYSYNNKNLNGNSVYIVQYDDGSTHLVDSNNNKYDLLTGKPITAKKTNIVLWKESSNFYELYKSGVITDNVVLLSSSYSGVINDWDGKKHYQTVDLVAEQKAEEEYQKKFGGK